MKLVLPEPESGVIDGLVREAAFTAGSRVLATESRSAIARRLHRVKAPPAAVESSRALCHDWLRTIFFVELDGELANDAGALAERHLLRSLDAIQLASALRLARSADDVVMATLDGDLRKACRAESLPVFPA